MNFGQIVKQLARGQPAAADLSEEDAHALFAAMLDGGVPDLELGAVLTALRAKGESAAELLGFHRAVTQRLYPLQIPASRLRPLAIPAYGGARSEHNLLPLLGLLLRRLGVPVLFHGTLEGSGRVACVYILRELGIMPHRRHEPGEGDRRGGDRQSRARRAPPAAHPLRSRGAALTFPGADCSAARMVVITP